jgi:hypothetical protein
MKRLLILFLFVTICCALNAQSSSSLQNITNICYDEEYTERIRVTGELNSSTLTILDKLKFINKKYEQKHHEYLNASGYATHDRAFMAHENMFPKWYSPPMLIRNDESGITSYFSTTNEYLPDGWTGGVFSETEHGAYISDGETGHKYYQEDYSTLANHYYVAHDTLVKSIGFLYQFVFKSPDAMDLIQMGNEGYQTSTVGDIITAQNESTILLWDLGQMAFVTQLIEGNRAVKTTKSYFTYYEAYDDYLLSKTITVVPETFENGDCYETVSETIYTDYSSGCNDSSALIKSNEESSNTVSGLSLHPNPASNSLIIQIPLRDRPSDIKLSDLSGKVIVQRRIQANSTQYELNISNLPMGIYIVKMQQGGEIFSSKFIKQ